MYYGEVTAGGDTYDPANGVYVENIDPKQVVGYNFTTDNKEFTEYLATTSGEIIFFGDPRSEVPVKYYTIIDHLLEVDSGFRKYYVDLALQSENFQYWK